MTIYKICERRSLASSRAQRRFPRRRGRRPRRLHPSLDCGAGARNRGQAFQRGLRVAADRGRRRRARCRAEVGTIPRRGFVSPSLRHAAACCRALGALLGARRRRAAHLSGARAMIGLLELLTRPLLRMLDPEDAHRLAITSAENPALRQAGRGRSAARRARLRAQFPQPARDGSRLRQARRGARCAASARLRLRRGRHRDAACAVRQSAPAPVPARP